MSGYDRFSYVQQAVKYGAYDYLLKPVNIHDMEEIIEKLKKGLDGSTRIFLKLKSGTALLKICKSASAPCVSVTAKNPSVI